MKRYPWRNWMSLGEAKRAFGALGLGDRDKATRYAAAYAASIAAERRRSVKGAGEWLRDRDFDGPPMAAQAQAEAAGLAKPRVFVIEHTDWWKAWVAHLRAAGRASPPTTTYQGAEPHLRGKRGWWFDSQLPPRAGPAAAEDAHVDFG